MIFPFLPFAIVSLVHLWALFVSNAPVEHLTKPMLMPALLLGFLIALPERRSRIALLGALGILLSWAGDVLLGDPGGIGFILGLSAFLLAHVVFIVLFLGALRTHRMPWAALVLALWLAALIAILAPNLGSLLVPVIVYGLVLGIFAAAGLGTTPLVAVGAALVLVSDSVLALKMFLPGFSLWEKDFLIMLAYLVGQGLVAVGAITLVNRRRAERAAA